MVGGEEPREGTFKRDFEPTGSILRIAGSAAKEALR
jgi:hypothetical protein